MKHKTYITNSPLQTKNLAKKLAREILNCFSTKKAVVIGLVGDLGGGKTTFLQGFARGLGIRQKILSPTFIIMKKFLISNSQFLNFYHIDCYRIKKPKELLALGFKEIISGPENIVAVEWADRIKSILPQNAIWIRFKFMDKKTRKITMTKFKMPNDKCKIKNKN